MSNGTASQFAQVVGPVTVALASALEGIDPKQAVKAVAQGQVLTQHLRRFFVPPAEESAVLRPALLITIPQVPVNYDLGWDERINQAGPNTGADWDVRKVGELWVTERKGIVLTDVTLVGFGQNVGSQQVLDFGAEWNLGRTMNPYETFALPAHRPTLHADLGRNAMVAVSLEHRDFRGEQRVCYSWWDDDERGCDLGWFDDVWFGICVFGFVRES